jgi:hypothetical protein
VLCIRGAAAVAEKYGLVSGAVSFHQPLNGQAQRRQAGVHEAVMDLDTPLDVAAKNAGYVKFGRIAEGVGRHGSM